MGTCTCNFLPITGKQAQGLNSLIILCLRTKTIKIKEKRPKAANHSQCGDQIS